jgi:hypothetical protein
MARMKDYLVFLEEQGYAVWNDTTEQYDYTVDDIYSTQIMNEYKAQSNAS